MNEDRTGQKRDGVNGTEAKADERNHNKAVESGSAGTMATGGGTGAGSGEGDGMSMNETDVSKTDGGTDGFLRNDEIGVNGGAGGFQGNDRNGGNGGPETGPIFAHRHRVRYHETDQMGVVYHSNYLNWFEIARTEWIRVIGYPYGRLEAEGLLLPVLEANVHYLQPAKYDDEVEVGVKLVECTPLRLGFTYSVKRVSDGKELATGSSRHVWMSRAWKPARLDKAVPDLYATLCGLVSADEKRPPT